MRRGTGISLGLGVVVIGGGYLAYTSIQRKRLFKQIMAEIGVSSVTLSSYDAWFSPTYHTDTSDKSPEYVKQDNSLLIKWADDINWSWGFFNDSETRIYSVLRAVPDGVALSQLSEKYQSRHGNDLKQDLNGLDDDEVREVATILSQKPSHTPVS